MGKKQDVREFLLITLGTVLVSAGVYFFKFPNHFSMGGVSGLAVLLGELFPHAWLTPSVFNTLINLLFLVLGFCCWTRASDFGRSTALCSTPPWSRSSSGCAPCQSPLPAN